MKKSAVLLIVLSFGLAPGAAFAEDAYPTHPILLTHGNTPGSNSDVMARIIADPLSRARRTGAGPAASCVGGPCSGGLCSGGLCSGGLCSAGPGSRELCTMVQR